MLRSAIQTTRTLFSEIFHGIKSRYLDLTHSYRVMLSCWHGDPGQRPSFGLLCQRLEALLDTLDREPGRIVPVGQLVDFGLPIIDRPSAERCWGPTTTTEDFRIMMTSSNGNIFRVTSLLCGEFTGHRLIPRTKASDAELWCFLWSGTEPTFAMRVAITITSGAVSDDKVGIMPIFGLSTPLQWLKVVRNLIIVSVVATLLC